VNHGVRADDFYFRRFLENVFEQKILQCKPDKMDLFPWKKGGPRPLPVARDPSRKTPSAVMLCVPIHVLLIEQESGTVATTSHVSVLDGTVAAPRLYPAIKTHKRKNTISTPNISTENVSRRRDRDEVQADSCWIPAGEHRV